MGDIIFAASTCLRIWIDSTSSRAHNCFRFPSEAWPSPRRQSTGIFNLLRRCVMGSKPTFAAFNQGQIPTIACFNQATTPLGVDLDALIAAMQAYIANNVAPVWGTPANLVKTTDFQPGPGRWYFWTMPIKPALWHITISRLTVSLR